MWTRTPVANRGIKSVRLTMQSLAVVLVILWHFCPACSPPVMSIWKWKCFGETTAQPQHGRLCKLPPGYRVLRHIKTIYRLFHHCYWVLTFFSGSNISISTVWRKLPEMVFHGWAVVYKPKVTMCKIKQGNVLWSEKSSSNVWLSDGWSWISQMPRERVFISLLWRNFSGLQRAPTSTFLKIFGKNSFQEVGKLLKGHIQYTGGVMVRCSNFIFVGKIDSKFCNLTFDWKIHKVGKIQVRKLLTQVSELNKSENI